MLNSRLCHCHCFTPLLMSLLCLLSLFLSYVYSSCMSTVIVFHLSLFLLYANCHWISLMPIPLVCLLSLIDELIWFRLMVKTLAHVFLLAPDRGLPYSPQGRTCIAMLEFSSFFSLCTSCYFYPAKA